GVERLRGLLPPLRNLGERDEPHAGVLAALVVVGGRGEEGARVAVRAEAGARMERLHIERPVVRLAADLVEGGEAERAVERRVLDALGGDGRRVLLEAPHPGALLR